jgi:hypothetical protein
VSHHHHHGYHHHHHHHHHLAHLKPLCFNQAKAPARKQKSSPPSHQQSAAMADAASNSANAIIKMLAQSLASRKQALRSWASQEEDRMEKDFQNASAMLVEADQNTTATPSKAKKTRLSDDHSIKRKEGNIAIDAASAEEGPPAEEAAGASSEVDDGAAGDSQLHAAMEQSAAAAAEDAAWAETQLQLGIEMSAAAVHGLEMSAAAAGSIDVLDSPDAEFADETQVR